MLNKLSKLSLLLIYILVLNFKDSSIFAQALNQFNFIGASVLPYTNWQTKNEDYFLLSREAFGKSKGTWDAFGGSRDANEKHPVITAAREFAEESMYKIFNNNQEAKNYIDIKSGHTTNILANEAKKFVIYITKFDYNRIQDFEKNFYAYRNQLINRKANHKFIEKDKIAWVKKSNLVNAIVNAPRDRQGRLITPIKVWANVVQPNGKRLGQEINLRPVLVSSLQSFFKGSKNFTLGKNPKIRFYTK